VAQRDRELLERTLELAEGRGNVEGVLFVTGGHRSIAFKSGS
jgi:hypothetical protein